MSGPISFTRMSLRDLFSVYDSVKIPKLQRDYAQGRVHEKLKRERFLHALKNQFSCSFSLNLDFVYGSTQRLGGREIFLPLDGQQRLTTLFLLHWYLAHKDDVLNQFLLIFADTSQELIASNFTYDVRPSSNEFFHHLCRVSEQQLSIVQSNSVAGWITNQYWFRKKWILDPTIKSCLVMLDAIHEIFFSVENGFQRLVKDKIITFDVLSLAEYGLSEELYIKMNARGKMLSRFENLKAGLSAYIGKCISQQSLLLPSKHFERQIDRVWTDLFWSWRPKHKVEQNRIVAFDEEFMRFFHACNVGWSLPQQMSLRDGNKENFKTIQEVLFQSYHFGFWEYHDGKLLTESFLQKWISLLDMLSSRYNSKSKEHRYFLDADGLFPYFKEKVFTDVDVGTTKQSILGKILYGNFPRKDKPPINLTERLLWYSYCSYLTTFGFSPTINQEKFRDWMRVISNLSKNVSDYYRFEDFSSSIEKVDQWLHEMKKTGKSITAIFADKDIRTENNLGRFTRAQLREEYLKARLLTGVYGNHKEWFILLTTAEQHSYFDGQIEFLLDFCGVLDHEMVVGEWSAEDDERFRQQFSLYYQKILTLFPMNPVESTIFVPPKLNRLPYQSSKSHLLELALLSKGNYLLRYGNNGYRYSTSAVYEKYTWKRFLGTQGNQKYDPAVTLTRDYFKDLLDDPLFCRIEIEDSLRKIATIPNMIAVETRDPSNRELFSKAPFWRESLLQFPQILDDCPAYLFGLGRHEPYPMAQFLVLSHRSHHPEDQELYATILYYLLREDEVKYNEFIAARDPSMRIEIGITFNNTLTVYCTGGYPDIGEEPHLYFFEKTEQPFLTDDAYDDFFSFSEVKHLGLIDQPPIHNCRTISIPVSKVFTKNAKLEVSADFVSFFELLLTKSKIETK